jgi:hypothetical protein
MDVKLKPRSKSRVTVVTVARMLNSDPQPESLWFYKSCLIRQGIMHETVVFRDRRPEHFLTNVPSEATGTFMQNQDAISEPRNRNPMESQKSKRVLFFYFLAQTCKTPCPCSKAHLYAPFIHEPTNTTARPNHHPNSGSNQIVLGSVLMP